MSEFQARKPRVTSKVVLSRASGHVGHNVFVPDVQPIAFGAYVNGKWEGVVEDPEDLMYTGPDTHRKGADLDCLTHVKWNPMSGTYWCTPCAINEGVAIGIEYPPAVRGEAQTLSFRRAKASVSRVREAQEPERTQQEWEEYGSAMTDSACDTWAEDMDREAEEALLGRPLMPNEY